MLIKRFQRDKDTKVQTAQLIKAPLTLSERLLTQLRIGVDEVVYDLIVNEEADVNATDSKDRTALIYSIYFHRQPEVAKLLLDKGADVNAKDDKGQVALMYAVQSSLNQKILETLIIDYNADAEYTRW